MRLGSYPYKRDALKTRGGPCPHAGCHDDIWLVSFMDYDLGYFDLETRVLEPLENPFGPKLLPM